MTSGVSHIQGVNQTFLLQQVTPEYSKVRVIWFVDVLCTCMQSHWLSLTNCALLVLCTDDTSNLISSSFLLCY